MTTPPTRVPRRSGASTRNASAGGAGTSNADNGWRGDFLEKARFLLQDTWYLAVLFVAALVLAAYCFSQESESRARSEPDSAAGPATVAAQARQAERLAVSRPQKKRPTEQEKALGVISRHQQRFDEDPRDPDAPALLQAMGNLYRQKLGDYERAAECYELLLEDYPDWTAVRRVYPQLATCYQRLDNRFEEHKVYRRMLKAFPEESQEFKYAAEQLGH